MSPLATSHKRDQWSSSFLVQHKPDADTCEYRQFEAAPMPITTPSSRSEGT